MILTIPSPAATGSRERANSLPTKPPAAAAEPLKEHGAAADKSQQQTCRTIKEEENENDNENEQAVTKQPPKSNLSRQVERQRLRESPSGSSASSRASPEPSLTHDDDMTDLPTLRKSQSINDGSHATFGPLRRTQSVNISDSKSVSHRSAVAKKAGWFHTLSQKLTGKQQSSPPPVVPSSPASATQFGLPVSQPKPISDARRKPYPSDAHSKMSPKSAPSYVDYYHPSHQHVGTPLSKVPSNPKPTTSTDQTTAASSVGSANGDAKGTGLINRLRRLSTRSPSVSESDLPGGLRPEIPVVLNKNTTRPKCKVPELDHVLPPRVRFALEVFEDDPPQQIPSRRPKQGNIIFKDDGEVIRSHPINPNYILPPNYHVAAISASTSAHDAAVRIANTIKGHGSLKPTKREATAGKVFEEEEQDDAASAKNLVIDTPMSKKEHEDDQDDASSTNSEEKVADESLEAIYTRCCHLREILPIPATLKQIQGKQSPLSVLRIVNPRPTLIEVLSFADFLAVVPVVIVQLDNCSLSVEMMEVILSSITNSHHLMALSMRNVVLDPPKWKLLCAFVAECSHFSRLDISIGTAASKPSSKSDQSKTEKHNRANADWGLLNKALLSRNGIEELLINGCMIPTEQLKLLFMQGLSKSTKRLGLALNDLHEENLVDVREWMQRPNCVVEGLDLGGNPLHDYVSELAEIMNSESLLFLSLNTCDLVDVPETREMFVETSKHTHLRFLDLSGNPRLFPGFTETLATILPLMPNLRRINLDNVDITSSDIVRLSEAFSQCKKLSHISLLGNHRLDSTACAALSVAAQFSQTIYIIECEHDLWPNTLQQRLAQNCLHNMESLAGSVSAGMKKDTNDLAPMTFEDKTSLVITGTELAKSVEDILESSKKGDELNTGRVAQAMIIRAHQVRETVQQSLTDLLHKRENTELSVEEKEALIRMCLLDVSLERVLNKYDTICGPESHRSVKTTPPPAITSHMLLADRPMVGGTPNDALTNKDLQVAPMDEEQGNTKSGPGSLSRNSSSTSIHLKKQEQEEGEMMKLSRLLRKDVDVGGDFDDEPLGDSSDSGDTGMDKSARAIDGVSGEQIRHIYWRNKGDGTLAECVEKLEEKYRNEFQKIFGNQPPLLAKEPEVSPADKSDKAEDPADESKIQAMDKVIDSLAQELKKEKISDNS